MTADHWTKMRRAIMDAGRDAESRYRFGRIRFRIGMVMITTIAAGFAATSVVALFAEPPDVASALAGLVGVVAFAAIIANRVAAAANNHRSGGH